MITHNDLLVNDLEQFLTENQVRRAVIIADREVCQLHGNFFRSFPCNYCTYPLKVSETKKNWQEIEKIMKFMLREKITTDTWLVNVGGGVICDMGSLSATLYKRGMHVLNIPTTLLSMIDAAWGGKTGVNMSKVKNAIGTYNNDYHVFIDISFLKTLPAKELWSAVGEMFKYALIADKNLWKKLGTLPTSEKMINMEMIPYDWIQTCIEIKQHFVLQDFRDTGIRRVLNAGHTLGHAIESLCANKNILTHGHAVALGLIAEAYISAKQRFLPMNTAKEIKSKILPLFPAPRLSSRDKTIMYHLIENDKKNNHGKICLPLIQEIGKCSPLQYTLREEILEAFSFLEESG
ncbi:MAG: 3-dehydroquinate synthase [Bacteroidales bacterium]|jgi:3-dehydroquinate synthase|nr:3-dehydroquinate synthase [Bacteroidales bacterium]